MATFPYSLRKQYGDYAFNPAPKMPIEHYENFPVASILLPSRLRPAVEAIYAFARSADDLADEGDATPEDRLHALTRYEDALDRIAQKQSLESELFENLAKTVTAYHLPMQPLRDLLSAFKQDVVTKRYASIVELMDYCRRSADPVGRLMLHLYDAADETNVCRSDAICSALQLINFWQDVAIDWEKERIYLPLEDLALFKISEAQIEAGTVDAGWRTLMQFEVARARTMLLSGAPLAHRLPGRIGWELRLVIQGGLRILERIELADYDVFHRRPHLGPRDWLIMLWRAICMRNRSPRNCRLNAVDS